MKYRYLGNSGLVVSRVCLGTMTFGHPDWGCDLDETRKIVKGFIEAGGNIIDTADLYASGDSEILLGKALKEHDRDSLVIATKCWFPTSDRPNAGGLSRKHILEAFEASLRRLGLEYVDLYQIHGPDPFTPIEETMSALHDLIRAGKVRYIGCSNLYGWQMVKANAAARALGGPPLISGQHLYNLIRRDVEREVIPAAADQGMGILPWSPLASGMLTGKYRGQEQPDPDSRFGKMSKIYMPRFWNEKTRNAVELLCQIAEDCGREPATVALAWILKNPVVSSVIIGARKASQLDASLAAADWELSNEDYERLAEAFPFDHGYPMDWMAQSFPNTFKYGQPFPGQTQFLPANPTP